MAENGHLETLKWARENGCPWSEWDARTCSDAAKGGHFELLKWVRENGCDWDHWICIYASKKGYMNILKWARENGCPWSEDVCINATKKWKVGDVAMGDGTGGHHGMWRYAPKQHVRAN